MKKELTLINILCLDIIIWVIKRSKENLKGRK